jgi:hypothetical protein
MRFRHRAVSSVGALLAGSLAACRNPTGSPLREGMTDVERNDERVVRAGLIGCVEKVSDTLACTASEFEEARSAVPDGVEELTSVGLLKTKSVRDLGGAEASPATQILVLPTIAEIDLPTACNVVVKTTTAPVT